MNPQAHHIVAIFKIRKIKEAENFAKTAKKAKTRKDVVLLSLMKNYDLRIREARAIYRKRG